jgi:hypothetical protein
MWSARLFISLLALSLLPKACHRDAEESPVVARAYEYELHQSDLAGLVGEGVSKEDSVAIVQNYIDQWIRQSVILSKAEKNVADNFDKQMKEYKNSLLTYAYEQQIVNQLLDTHVTYRQISDYYDEHRNQFQLKGSIVKTAYVMAPNKSPVLPKLRKIVSQYNFDEENVVELEELASRYGLSGYYDADTWIPFYQLQAVTPIAAYNETLYLKQNRTIVLSDDSLTYLVRIIDYKVTDDVSPLELQKDNIRAIILNHRKLEILNKMQADLLKEAEDGGYVKRY